MPNWITTAAAWESKALALELAQTAFTAGRLCDEASCLARAELGFSLRAGWVLGLCPTHATAFAAERPDAFEGLPKRLGPEDVLDGPWATDKPASE